LSKLENVTHFENVASILAVVCVFLGRGLQNKGEVAGVILLLCVIHFSL